MSAIPAWLATYAVHSTLLLGGVAFLTTFVVRRDAWQDTLWKAALVGGLVTATVQLAIWHPTAGRPPGAARYGHRSGLRRPAGNRRWARRKPGPGRPFERDGRDVGDPGARASAAATDP